MSSPHQPSPSTFMMLPQPVRFATSGAIGSVAFWGLNEMALAANPFDYHPVTVSFVVAYVQNLILPDLYPVLYSYDPIAIYVTLNLCYDPN